MRGLEYQDVRRLKAFKEKSNSIGSHYKKPCGGHIGCGRGHTGGRQAKEEGLAVYGQVAGDGWEAT